MEHRVGITDTTLRDAHQSLWATRMRTSEMLPVADRLDKIGYHSLEVWGGSTFDVCLRYLNEDPWERLRQLKKNIKKTPLQLMLRGQSLVGYQQYPDDVVEAFITKAVENGISIFRFYDALNDIRNLDTAIHSTKKAGAHVQAAMVYTVSPIHTIQHYVDLALQLAEMGADSICIKDTAGLLAPYQAYELVRTLKKNIDLPVQLHCHYIGGLAVGTYLKAAEAGVDVIDTATVPLAFGPSQPPVETVVRALQGSPYDTKLDIHRLFEIAEYFEKIRRENGYKRGVTRINDMRVFDHQVPGGTISNLVTQLEEQKALYRLGEVLEEIPRVREDLGYPPLVTPTSQIVGTQAVLNVLTGERYKLVPGEVRDYIQGYYGKPPAPINKEIARKVLGDREPITCRPADLLEPRMEKLRNEMIDLVTGEEDIISYALFPQVARRFFEMRRNGRYKPELPLKNEKPAIQEKIALPPPKQNSAQAEKSTQTAAVPAMPAEREVVRKTSEREVDDMNISDVKDLIKFIDETDITEVSLESTGVKLAIRKGHVYAAEPAMLPSRTQSPPALPEKHEPAAAPVEASKEKDAGLTPVPAPMVGMFYRSPAPEAAPFVRIGDRIKKGQTLCIIEAMKLMNEIKSEVDGEVMDIKVENGHPVEYGQTLFLVKE
ncbi:acetyl-CoA carboxylase biotin carboxyl carrier protein [Pelotomaculum propionicicum]|uniref:2-oxoglutarate carboxylase large subunit n=1 Tax=Pelotomaculum propionicicum TaxID=258475 RepID=A0A4Y7RIV6_9FIRM|nr:acetyl-CoA carboxylase biotin carboxyl carrier protein [Pelotomaculum propionicicum]NLI11991.1 acetyl-CoA carboxylase biotin carboxyl carrier protein [Peptococcaceae bacterium]TEB08924.1 2-oxoglutarate carboxylase large subunit [Pelotomaculum propionicicum]